LAPLDYEVGHFPIEFSEKGCFPTFEWAKSNFTTFGLPGKILLATTGNLCFSLKTGIQMR